MPTFALTVNGSAVTVDADSDMPLLWALRDLLQLTGTKFGCGIGLCGACAVFVDGTLARSCSVSIADADGKPITTIEGLSADATHKVQQAWLAESVAQCGYCQTGQIMTAVSLLNTNPSPSDNDIDSAFASSLCRCGTYLRIRRAVHRAAAG